MSVLLLERALRILHRRYTPEAPDRDALNSPVLSCSLPLARRPVDARAFCRGLLPEGRALDSLAARAGVAANDTFSLLARYGRDVAGALVIANDGRWAARSTAVRPPTSSRWTTRVHDGDVDRVHQEDVCQALARNPDDRRGRGTYEAHGGPSFAEVATLLDTYAEDPGAELDRLVAVVAFTVLIGNADTHGKNLALLHPHPDRITLAPLYDTVPTALWPTLRTDAAMSVGGHWPMATITLEHIVREASRWPHPAGRAGRVTLDTVAAVQASLASGDVPADVPVAAFVAARADALEGGGRP